MSGLLRISVQINVLTDDGRMNEVAGPFAGQSRFEVRMLLCSLFDVSGNIIRLLFVWHAHACLWLVFQCVLCLLSVVLEDE